jgi:catechol 2,3-dioxygenase-like lactoylglutathione lyase family enzyme
MIKFGPIIEVILYVEDMDSQVQFYRDTLGLSLSYPQELEDYSDQMWVTFDTGICTLALHCGGGRDFGRDAPKFVFEVKNVESTRQFLLDRGVLLGEIRTAAPGVSVCDGEDPEGNNFSIESRKTE